MADLSKTSRACKTRTQCALGLRDALPVGGWKPGREIFMWRVNVGSFDKGVILLGDSLGFSRIMKP